MAGSLQILVYDQQEKVFGDVLMGKMLLGRQREAKEALYSKRVDGDRTRVAVARLDEDTVSREHALLEPLPGGLVRVTNCSAKVGIRLEDGDELRAGQTRELVLPTYLVLGPRTIRLSSNETREQSIRGLAHSTMPPGFLTGSGLSRFPTVSLKQFLRQSGSAQPAVREAADMEEVVRWLQTTMEVLQSAANSSDFFQKAAQAVVDIVGLHRGRVLLRDGEQWKPKATWTAPAFDSADEWKLSRTILNKVLAERRTFWLSIEDMSAEDTGSLSGVEVVVASPILDPRGEVLGVIYGDCMQDKVSGEIPRVTQIEAIVVELLARGVAVGLARMEQERVAIAARVQFEQFFTRELAHQLALEPTLLEGRDCEVSLLFCDIRAFSRISEKLGPEGTVRWISEVMGALSDCVQEHLGVLVDYIGDELLAMWGAPVAQPDHPRMACQAALDMLRRLPELNRRWESELGEPLNIGIGINTGCARVGNTGSRHKFKYGPLGNTVNLASRVQGATKYLKCPLLLTEGTRSCLGDGFNVRRLCQACVVNIQQPVDLYELVPEDHPGWPDLKNKYEQALEAFERRDFRPAARILGNLLGEVPDDGPSLVLMSRAVNALVDGPAERHPVWDLPGK